MPDTQRIKLLRETADALLERNVVLGDGEICLIDSSGNGYDSLVIGNGQTEARSLKLIPLNVSKGSVFLGMANSMTIPAATPTCPVYYLASDSGTYEGFGNIVIEPGEIVFLVYRYGGWSKIKIIQVDEELSETSTNPVQNKVLYRALKDLENKIVEGAIKVPVDSEFSDESENPIMNRTVTRKFSEFNWYEN